MESKHKNALIVALLAVVLVMAVGYAAFAQQLTINSTATINEGDPENPNWHVHFNTDNTTTYQANMGNGGSVAPTGSISFDGDTVANISATLNTPGDNVVFTFTVVNSGTINASLATPKLVLTQGSDTDGNPSDNSVKLNNIIFTVSELGKTTLANGGDTTTFTVTAKFDENATSVDSSNNSAHISVTLVATQSA